MIAAPTAGTAHRWLVCKDVSNIWPCEPSQTGINDDLSMTNSSGMPATNDPTAANSTGPDWNLVPFDVACARCGHDLRGQTDPTCPACKLEFDWSAAVPIEKLTCGKCDYRLFGLTETRCPECGERFTWEKALAAYERRRHLLFEYRWRDQPIRSLVRTVYLMFRPRLLWQELDIHDRPRVRPLIVMAAFAHLMMVSLYPPLLVVFLWLTFGPNFPGGTGSTGIGNYWRILLLVYSLPTNYLLTLLLAIWSSLILGSLLLFRQSMKFHRVRPAQVFRVWAHCIPVPGSIAILVASAAAYSIMAAGYGPNDTLAFLLFIGANLYTCFLLRQGYKRYLRMPHAWGVAVASHLIGLLGLVIVALQIAFGGIL